jgi:Mg-chelatase subunit ChlI
MPITVMENVVSNAERRAVRSGEPEVVPRIADVFAALPAITGKLELEYEGELVGGAAIARELIRRAADATLKARAGTPNLDKVIIWFDEGGALQVDDEQPSRLVAQAFTAVPDLLDVVHRTGLATPDDPGRRPPRASSCSRRSSRARRSAATTPASTAAPPRSRAAARDRTCSAEPARARSGPSRVTPEQG